MTYANPAAIMESVNNAFWQGHDRVKQARTQNALAAFMKNPSMEGIAGVAQHDPMMAYQLRGMEEKRQAGIAEQQMQARKVDLQRRAAAQDPEALAELAGIDYNAWKGIKDEQREDIKERADYIGNAALQISQLPENQRPQAWDQAVAEGAKTWPDLAEFTGRYSEQALNTAIRRAGMVKTLYDWSQPDYMAIPPGGTLVNTRDPQAIQQFGDQQAGGLAPGAEVNGFIFRGGDPNDRNNWAPAGGASGNAGGNFPGAGN